MSLDCKNYILWYALLTPFYCLIVEPGVDDDHLLPARVSKPILDTNVNEGETAAFKLVVTGTPPPKVEWYLNGEELKCDGRRKIEVKGNTHHLKISDVTSKDAGKYSVEVHNRVGRDLVKATLLVKGELLAIFDTVIAYQGNDALPLSIL